VSCTVSICVLCDAFSIPTEKIESNRKAWPRTWFSNAIKMYSLFLNVSQVELCLQICVKCGTVVGETEKHPNGILVFKHNFDVYYVYTVP
jgi:hypothetical protein